MSCVCGCVCGCVLMSGWVGLFGFECILMDLWNIFEQVRVWVYIYGNTYVRRYIFHSTHAWTFCSVLIGLMCVCTPPLSAE